MVACKRAVGATKLPRVGGERREPSPLDHTPVWRGTERPLLSTDLGGALGPAQPPAPFPAPSGLLRRPPAGNRPDKARAARSSGFLGPTWEGERHRIAASLEPDLARGRSSLLPDPSLESEIRQVDLSVNQVRVRRRFLWGTGAPPLHTHLRGSSLMNLNTAVVHHGTAGAGEASLENRILTLQGDNCGPGASNGCARSC